MISFRNQFRKARTVRYLVLGFQSQVLIDTDNQEERDRFYDIKRIRGEQVVLSTIVQYT